LLEDNAVTVVVVPNGFGCAGCGSAERERQLNDLALSWTIVRPLQAL
jgi:hypothetical protein